MYKSTYFTKKFNTRNRKPLIFFFKMKSVKLENVTKVCLGFLGVANKQ